MKKFIDYETINPILTGTILKKRMDRAGYTVADIQKILHLTCPQTVYRWIHGERLPSVNHLYMLSRLFGIHMEELLSERPCDIVIGLEFSNKNSHLNRIAIYEKYLFKRTA